MKAHLGIEDGTVGVHGSLILGGITDKTLPVGSKAQC